MAQKQMAERRADDRQPDTIAKHRNDGRWRDSPQHRDSVDPATGEVIGRYAVGGRGEARARIGQRLTIVRTSLRARSPVTLMAP